MNDEQFRKLQSQKARRRTPTNGCFDNFFYTLPDSKLLTILIVISVILVIVFLLAFRYVTKNVNFTESTNNVVASYLGIVAVPVGVILSFIIASAWAAFSDAQSKENEEATQLLLLYNVIRQLPNTEELQLSIKRYTAFIIEVEFPLMEKGMQSIEGLQMVIEIGDMIYEYDLFGQKESILYREAIDMYQLVISLRITRLGYAVFGLAPELWWVLILGVIIVIVVSYFIYTKSTKLQIILTALVAAALVSMLFLIVALNFPYRGDFGLDSLPFEIALANMMRPDVDFSNRSGRNKNRNKHHSDKHHSDKNKHHSDKETTPQCGSTTSNTSNTSTKINTTDTINTINTSDKLDTSTKIDTSNTINTSDKLNTSTKINTTDTSDSYTKKFATDNTTKIVSEVSSDC